MLETCSTTKFTNMPHKFLWTRFKFLCLFCTVYFEMTNVSWCPTLNNDVPILNFKKKYKPLFIHRYQVQLKQKVAVKITMSCCQVHNTGTILALSVLWCLPLCYIYIWSEIKHKYSLKESSDILNEIGPPKIRKLWILKVLREHTWEKIRN